MSQILSVGSSLPTTDLRILPTYLSTFHFCAHGSESSKNGTGECGSDNHIVLYPHFVDFAFCYTYFRLKLIVPVFLCHGKSRYSLCLHFTEGYRRFKWFALVSPSICDTCIRI